MSALGDYVHLRKYNYNKYGLLRKSGRGEDNATGQVLSQQTNYWRTRFFEMRAKFDMKASAPDPVEEELNRQMKSLSDFMKELERQNSNDPTSQKAMILQEVLGKDWKKMLDLIRIDFSSGKVSLANELTSVSDFLGGNDIKTLKKLSSNQLKIFLTDNTSISHNNGFANLKEFLQQALNHCQEYFTAAKEIAKGQQKTTKMKKEFNQIEKLLNIAQNQIDTNDFIAQVKGSGNYKYIDLSVEGKVVANKLTDALRILGTPDLAKIKGDLMEYIYYHFISQGTNIAVKAACDSIGNAVTKGNITYTVNKDISKYLEKMAKSSKTKIKVVDNHIIGQDQITEASVSYDVSSERKADVRVNVTVKENGQNLIKNTGISIKNYMANNIGLVSESPLINFLLGGEYDINEVNHLLNIFAASDVGGDDSFLASAVRESRLMAGSALQLSILYSALSGANVGKEDSNMAEYILLNRPNEGGAPFIVSIVKVVSRIVANYNANIRFKIEGGKTQDLTTLSLINDKVIGDNTIDAANQRIAKLILQLHQLKVSASIPMTSIVDAYNTWHT